MTRITPRTSMNTDNDTDAGGGVTLTLSEEQLQALGVKKLPAGATLQLHGTATVRPPEKGDAAGDTDGDAATDAQGGDDDGDEAGASGASGASTTSGAITLHITALALTAARKAPDKVLYGSGA